MMVVHLMLFVPFMSPGADSAEVQSLAAPAPSKSAPKPAPAKPAPASSEVSMYGCPPLKES